MCGTKAGILTDALPDWASWIHDDRLQFDRNLAGLLAFNRTRDEQRLATYLAAVGMSGTPEDYLARVKALESQFLVLLKQAHKN